MAIKEWEIAINKKLPQREAYLKKLGINIDEVKDKQLLATAFIHKSFAADYKDIVPYNERLEFVWDAILWGVVAKYLYLTLTDQSESVLTLYKIALVREEMLAEVALEIDLAHQILVGKGEQKRGGNFKNKILADSLEALIGYIYLDLWYEEVEKFIKNTVLKKLPKVGEKVNIKSYKTSLQELIQKKYKTLPTYKDFVNETDDRGNPLTFRSEVWVKGQKVAQWIGPNKKKAQEDAAKIAYEALLNGKTN